MNQKPGKESGYVSGLDFGIFDQKMQENRRGGRSYHLCRLQVRSKLVNLQISFESVAQLVEQRTFNP